jgi:hypothetical protein
MESLLQTYSRLRLMASGTADSLVSLLQFALVEDIFPVFIDVMTILAGKPGFNVTVVKKRNRRSLLLPKVF